jgi:membrane protein
MQRVWAGDRSTMRGWRSLGCRLLRLVTWTGSGFFRHKLSMRAVALTYYTVFSLVPLLAVSLWIAKAFDWLPDIDVNPEEPVAALAKGNAPLNQAIATLTRLVHRLDMRAGGLVSLAPLAYAVARLFKNVDGAVNTIAGASGRPMRYRRLLGYVVVLVLPAVLTAGFGLVGSVLVAPLRALVGRAVGEIQTVEMVAGVGVAIAAIALALAILYGAAARARVPAGSAVVGGLVAACLLLVTAWVFVSFQVGVSMRSAVSSGVAAVPVLFVWIYVSWLMILIGAELAVGHAVERIVRRGVSVLSPDAATTQIVGVLVMAEAARAPAAGGASQPSQLEADDMAREFGVLPQAVRAAADRLVQRGLLARSAKGYVLRADPDQVRLSDVCDAMARDPADADGRAALLEQLGPHARASLARGAIGRIDARGDVTLRQLADRA